MRTAYCFHCQEVEPFVERDDRPDIEPRARLEYASNGARIVNVQFVMCGSKPENKSYVVAA